MSADLDLWGELPTPDGIRPPVAILREQAQLLGDKTKNVLQAEVSSSTEDSDIILALYIIAPALEGYSYHVLNVQHKIGFYPLYVVDVAKSAGKKCENEEQYMRSVHEILASDQTRKVVAALLSQSMAMA